MINVTLKGGAVKEFEPGVSPADVAKSIGMGLYKSACAARVDGEAVDLRTPLEKDCELEILTFDSPEGKHAFWHTGAHIMAQAIPAPVPGCPVRHRPGAGRRLVLRHRRHGALYAGPVRGHRG